MAWASLVAQRETRHPISGRVYAGTMDVSGAEWLDRPEREEEEATSKALRLLDVRPGSTVADIGAGSGYFTVELARLVGPSGRVFATDIQAGMLEIIGRKVRRAKLTNVTAVLGEPDDPKLPAGVVDLALMVDVYHELHAPQAVLRRIRDSLAPEGRLVLLEYREEDPNVPILPLHKMSIKNATLEVEAEGFALETVKHDLPWQHVLVFRRR